MDHCSGWFRFTDDVFVVWTGDIGTLYLLNDYLNYLVPCLKFNITFSSTKILFLDTMLNIQGQSIVSDLYIKHTDHNQLLHFKSFHPPGVYKSMPNSQLIQVARVVSDPVICQNCLGEIVERPKQRGYPYRIGTERT